MRNFFLIKGRILSCQPDPEAIEVEVPWWNLTWQRTGGAKRSPYPPGKKTTIRVPKDIAFEVQRYAVWLANQDKE